MQYIELTWEKLYRVWLNIRFEEFFLYIKKNFLSSIKKLSKTLLIYIKNANKSVWEIGFLLIERGVELLNCSDGVIN